MEVGASPAQMARWKRYFDFAMNGAFEFPSSSDADVI